jgi:putative CocE/NonD family hydrolase
MDHHAGYHSEHWRRYLTIPITDVAHWDPIRYQPRITEVDLPVLHITGWYDDVQPGTIRNFTALTAPGVDPSVRAKQQMIVGPWDHGCSRRRQRHLGRVDFGPGAELDLPALERRWLSAVLSGRQPDSAPVRIFVMGRNEWRDEQEWPLARTVVTPYYLASGGGANTSSGDGVLTTDEPAGAGAAGGWAASDSFRYDPADPVPFISDHASSSQIGGPDDYAEIERRRDVLCYSGPLLEEELEVTGTVRLELWAASSALDTDFTAKLLDVHPDGFVQRLCDSMVRARFRDGYRSPERFLTPGEPTRFEIDMWSTSHVFLPGHRVRLEISSSAFPKYDRNLNTGGPIATGTEMVVAENTVFHDADHPSRLTLPVIPAGAS